MGKFYIEDRVFCKEDFTQNPPERGEYENCLFKGCDFSECDLSAFTFIACEFEECNLSLAKLGKTGFQEVVFSQSKMLGLRFDTCNEFGLSFTFNNCLLDHSVFFKLRMKKTIFRDSRLMEVDFAESDLSESIFDNCDLSGAVFENTNLQKANFRSSFNYSFDPELNQIRGAIFSKSGVIGLLSKYTIVIEGV